MGKIGFLLVLLQLAAASSYGAGTLRTFKSALDTTGLAVQSKLDYYGKPIKSTGTADISTWFSDTTNVRPYTAAFKPSGTSMVYEDQFTDIPAADKGKFTYELHMDVKLSAGTKLSFEANGQLFVFATSGGATAPSAAEGYQAVVQPWSTAEGGVNTLLFSSDSAQPTNKYEWIASTISGRLSFAGKTLGLSNSPLQLHFFYVGSATPKLVLSIQEQAFCSSATSGVPAGLMPFSAAEYGGKVSIVGPNYSNNAAWISSSAFYLIQKGDDFRDAISQVYTIAKQQIYSGFTTHFEYTIDELNQGTGFAFVMHDCIYGLGSGIGSGKSLGYAFDKSLAIEFDTFSDDSSDTSGDHIAVHTQYGATNAPGNSKSNKLFSDPPTSLTGTHKISITYAPESATATKAHIYVWVDGKLSHKEEVDHARVLSEIGPNVHLGFTTANGFSNRASITISNWEVLSVPASGPTSTVTFTGVGNKVTVSKTPASSANFELRVKDACGRDITANAIPTSAACAPITDCDTQTQELANGNNKAWLFGTTARPVDYTIKINGQAMGNSPFKYELVAGATSHLGSSWQFKEATYNNQVKPQIDAGTFFIVEVTSKDQYGNPQIAPTSGFEVFFNSEARVPTTQSSPGVYTATLTSKIKDDNKALFVSHNGLNLPESKAMSVAAGPVNAKNTILSLVGATFQAIPAGSTNIKLYIDMYDEFNNKIDTALVTPPELTVTDSVTNQTANAVWANSRYEIPLPAIQKSGQVLLSVQGNGIELNYLNGVQLYVIPGAPVKLKAQNFKETVVTGSLQHIEFQLADVYDNPVTTQSTNNLDVSVVVGGSTKTFACNTAMPDDDNWTGLSCVFESGIYNVYLRPLKAGVSHQVDLKGQNLNTGSATFTVATGGLSSDFSKVVSIGSPYEAGSAPGAMGISLRDSGNNAISGVQSSPLVLLLRNSIGQPAADDSWIVFNDTLVGGAGGDYTLSYTAKKADTYTIEAKLIGNDKSLDAVQTIIVENGPADPTNFVFTGLDGVFGVSEPNDKSGIFYFNPRDQFGNNLRASIIPFNLSFIGSQEGTFTQVYDADGESLRFKCSFVVATDVNKQTQSFKIAYKYTYGAKPELSATVVYKGSETITITPVQGSRNNARVKTGSLTPASPVAGTSFTLTIEDWDNSIPPKPRTAAQLGDDFVYSVSLKNKQTGAQYPSTSVTLIGDKGTSNEYKVDSASPFVAGTYECVVALGGTPSSTPSPDVVILPGSPTRGYSSLTSAGTTTHLAGSDWTAVATLADQFGNKITAEVQEGVECYSGSFVVKGVFSASDSTYKCNMVTWTTAGALNLAARVGTNDVATALFDITPGPPEAGELKLMNGTLQSRGRAGKQFSQDLGYQGLGLQMTDQYGNIAQGVNTSKITVQIFDADVDSTTTVTVYEKEEWFLLNFIAEKVNTVPRDEFKNMGYTKVSALYNNKAAAALDMEIYPDFIANIENSELVEMRKEYTADETLELKFYPVDRFGNNMRACFQCFFSPPLLVTFEAAPPGLAQTTFRDVKFSDKDGSNDAQLITAKYGPAIAVAGTYKLRVAWNDDGGLGSVLDLTQKTEWKSQIVVKPAAPDATKLSVIRAIPNVWIAGDSFEFVYGLRDSYGNNIGDMYNDTAVSVEIVRGSVFTGLCTAGAYNKDFLVTTLQPTKRVQDEVTFELGPSILNTSGTYSVFPVVDGKYKTICETAQQFSVGPGELDAAASIVTGPAFKQNPLTGYVTAGQPEAFQIVLTDKYQNPILDISKLTVTLGRQGFTPSCNNLAGSPGIQDFEPTETSPVALVDDVFVLDFTAKVQGEYRLIITVTSTDNPTLVQKLGPSDNCKTVVVRSWYAHSFASDRPTETFFAGQPIIFTMTAKDQYMNDVPNRDTYAGVQGSGWKWGGHSFTLDFKDVVVVADKPLDEYQLITGPGNVDDSKKLELDVNFIPAWPGNYSGYLFLQNAPHCDVAGVCQPETTQERHSDIQVLAAVCPGNGYRCGDNNQCVTDRATCAGATSETAVASDLTRRKTNCPKGTTLCADQITCAPVDQCPTALTCPKGYKMCANSRTCVHPRNSCQATTCSPPEKPCPNGGCATHIENCPSITTCPTGKQLCPDGSCKTAAECADVFYCFKPYTFVCPDGSCRMDSASCPTTKTCPTGHVLCESGVCSPSLSTCPSFAATTCPNGVRCPDGSCSPNMYLCSSKSTCPPGTVKCQDGSCKEDVDSCSLSAPSCAGAVCADGSCSRNGICPTAVTCPFPFVTKCPDNTCVQDLSRCSGKSPVCAHVTCPDGSCAPSFDSCPTSPSCPLSRPIRCPNGNCVTGPTLCLDREQSLKTSACTGSQVRCAGGECADHADLCPTHITCPEGQARCFDGTCNENCDHMTADSESKFLDSFKCTNGQVGCPMGGTGMTCGFSWGVEAIDSCPKSHVCPKDKPVRCHDSSCVHQARDCPPADQSKSRTVDKIACPDGGFYSDSTLCAQGVTCPLSLPIKCWDQTCRVSPDDCPPVAKCTSKSAPFLCNSGNCVGSLALCSTSPATCESQKNGNVKCSFSVAAPGAVINKCVPSVSDCGTSVEDWLKEPKFCPNRATRCMDGTCRQLPISCPPLMCPLNLPHRCPGGLCTTSADLCPRDNGCPAEAHLRCALGGCKATQAECDAVQAALAALNQTECKAPKQRCADGSCGSKCVCKEGDEDCTEIFANGCAAGKIMCHQKICKQPSECVGTNPGGGKANGANLCPFNLPFQCEDGQCALSSTHCLIRPPIPGCPAVRPLRCADGSCVKSSVQCPVLTECPDGEQLCPDGRCISTLRECSFMPSSCPEGYTARCPNGACVSSTKECPSPLNGGCPVGLTKCSDGHCKPADACPTAPAKTPKCWDGSVVDNCPPRNKCTKDEPYLLNGVCTASFTADGDYILASNNCPAGTPIRCANGECAKYPYKAGLADSCPLDISQDAVVCGDGSSAILASHCRPILCPGTTTLCANNTCGEGCTVRDLSKGCPAREPIACPSGKCVKSAKDCESKPQNICASSEFHCADGSCRASAWECVQDTFKRHNGAAAAASDVGACTGKGPGGVVCPDGSCRAAIEDCPYVQRCPRDQPLFCPDGSCTSTACAAPAPYRVPDQLLLGCPATQPYFCEGKAVMCVANEATCNAQVALVCKGDCSRDVHAQMQTARVRALAGSVIDISLLNNAPTTRLTLSPGTTSSDAIISVVPERISRLPSTVVSAPFRVKSSVPLNMDAIVEAAVDRQSLSANPIELGIPCQYLETFRVGQRRSNASLSAYPWRCNGFATISPKSIDLKMEAEGQLCPNIAIAGSYLSHTNTSDSTDCVCVTSATTNLPTCFHMEHQTQRPQAVIRAKISELTSGSPGGKCFDLAATPTTDILEFNLTRDGFSNPCLESGVNSREIDPYDLCLAYTADYVNWQCYEPSREARLATDSNSTYGPPKSWMRGRLPARAFDASTIWAFVNIPLPPPTLPVKIEPDWWDQYGTTVIVTLVLLFLFLAISGYAISRLNRYRQKYKREKTQLDMLHDKAAKLDEYEGGLGIHGGDEDIEMVANPLQLKIQDLQKRLEETQGEFGIQQELDAQKAAELEAECQAIMAEINKTKKQLNESVRGPKRDRQASGGSPGASSVVNPSIKASMGGASKPKAAGGKTTFKASGMKKKNKNF